MRPTWRKRGNSKRWPIIAFLRVNKDGHDADVLLLTSIDFRFFHKVVEHIADAGLSGKYDHVNIAGAELGRVVDFPQEPKLHILS